MLNMTLGNVYKSWCVRHNFVMDNIFRQLVESVFYLVLVGIISNYDQQNLAISLPQK